MKFNKKNIKKAVKYLKSELRMRTITQNNQNKESFIFNDILYSIENKEIKILSYRGNKEELVIPEKIQDKNVTVIAKGAFKNNTKLENVILPETVRVLGAEAFEGCCNLKEVYLPVDLEVINEKCFLNCTALKEVQLPYEIKKICKRAFKNCTSLTILKNYNKYGISAVKVVCKDSLDYDLPIQLEYIGEEAFAGCENLKSVAIPYAVKQIKKNTFLGCKAIKELTLHDCLEKIEEGAFSNCNSLKKMRISNSVISIAKDAFKGTDLIILCDEGSVIHEYAIKNGIKVKVIPNELPKLLSMMLPLRPDEEYKSYFTKDEAVMMEEKCELRPAFNQTIQREKKKMETLSSRYYLEDGIYKKKSSAEDGSVRILMTGDLMCKQKHQEQCKKDGEYNFDGAFQYVKDILAKGDFVIGNMEAMISPSLPYTSEHLYVNGRPYLNAPEEFAHAIRKAGFDAVINAQNHVYDTGTLGILETLDMLNRSQLMHTGAFAGKEDKRYLVIQVNGICIGILAYFDGARQPMKKANFTEYGKQYLVNAYDKEQVIRDVQEAKAEGAEFIIAYCHWGREYTAELTNRQLKFAQEVVDAGVDYIIGAHSHCLQPYNILISADGRKVPVVFSAGNFLSEIGINPRITKDSIIVSLQLTRNEEGKVIIEEDGYYPCRIMELKNVRGGYTVVPTDTELLSKNSNSILQEAEKRISKVMGLQFKNLSVQKDICREYSNREQNSYILNEPSLLKVKEEKIQPESGYIYNQNRKIYEGKEKLDTNEATILCAGQIMYDAVLGKYAKFGDTYSFRPNFKLVKSCFEKVDFSIGNLTSMVCEDFLSTEMLESQYNPNPYYSNARKEYLEALKYAGFDCLAIANPNNLDTGTEGIFKTVENIEKSGMLSVGAGLEKNKVFDINGIRVGVISYTLNCYDFYKYLTCEGAEKLLNIYSEKKAIKDINQIKNQGAEFVLVYLNCGSRKEKTALRGREELGIELAEAGADYVICTVPDIVSKYSIHKTKDGRNVPIASSIGNFMTGNVKNDSCISALFKLTLYKTPDGKIEVEDQYIPLKQFETLDCLPVPIVPALSCYYPKYTVKAFPKVKKTLGEMLGEQIPVSNERKIKIGTENQAQLTYQEIYNILEVRPSKKDKERLDLKKMAPVIATRRAELKEGCVVVLVKHTSYKRDEFQITLEQALQAKSALIISEQFFDEIPCIVVPNCMDACRKIFKTIKGKYNAFTVAVTGTAGKTTTKELMSCVFDTHYRTLHVKGNYNTFYTAGATLQKLRKEDEAYIQEVHGGSPNSAKSISEVICPDVAIITSIGDGHLMDMGTIENVIKGKLEIASGLKKTGALVVNDDNEYLKDLQLDGVRIIRYSTHNIKCDYYAQNIVDMGNKVKFQIVCKEGMFNVILKMQGLHNVENALGVFACAREAGIPPYKITAGLTHYVPDSDKQRFLHFKGYNMIIDTYSATPLSVVSAMQMLSNYPIPEGNRKIAILGDIPALGESSIEKHKEVGEKICKLNFDLMLCVGSESECVGNESEYFVRAAVKAGKEAYFYKDREEFNRKLVESIRPGDFLLFKSGTRSHLKEKTIYPLFGLVDK